MCSISQAFPLDLSLQSVGPRRGSHKLFKSPDKMSRAFKTRKIGDGLDWLVRGEQALTGDLDSGLVEVGDKGQPRILLKPTTK